MMRVKPYVNSVSWDYTVLLDPNKAFAARHASQQRAPHFLVDAEGQVVWQHNNYADGDEEELYEELLKLAENERDLLTLGAGPWPPFVLS